MNRFAFHTLAILLLFIGHEGHAQFKADPKPISAGWQMGISTSYKGAGFSLHYLKGSDNQQYVAGLDLNMVRDGREYRSTSFFGNQGKKYVFGKLNNLIVLSPSVGIQKNIFPAGAGNLLNLRLGAKVGPAIGLLNPYYLEIFAPVAGRPQLGDRVVEAYDPTVHTYTSIVGRAPILSSPLDLSTQIGVSAKTYALLDFSNHSEAIRAIQVGVNVDWFPSAVPIMADFIEARNNQLFFAVHIGLVLGNRW
ncbi:MAG: hypothetical protein NWR72_16975 [Bacteroidia bacterium]|nr:hypothetical protein [Bacteroidia bacterium]